MVELINWNVYQFLNVTLEVVELVHTFPYNALKLNNFSGNYSDHLQ